MSSLPEPLLSEVFAALKGAGRADLVARLEAIGDAADVLTSREAAGLLGVASPNTVKNWLEAGHFPGAFRTPGGHWRFRRADVVALRARMDALRAMNARGEITLPDDGDDAAPPPLL